MLISIIIPVFNVEQYLSYCIDSILKQSDSDFELLLIDDGSSDGSGAICDKYAQIDNRVRVFHQKNKGASSARNVGLDNARGEWISFVDADDWVADNYIKEFKTIGNKADITFFPCREIFQNGSVQIRHLKSVSANTRKEIEAILYELKYGYIGDVFGWTVAKFIRSSLITENKIRFKEELVFREDEIFTMDVCRYVKSVEVLDTPLYNYRILNTGLTSRGIQPTDFLLLARNIERNLPYFSHKEFLEREIRRMIDYHIDNFRNMARIRNLFVTMRECHFFFSQHPKYVPLARDIRLAQIMSHSYLLSYGILLFDRVLNALKERLR